MVQKCQAVLYVFIWAHDPTKDRAALRMQVANLKLVQEQPCLRDRTVMLAGTATLRFGHAEREALLIKPDAQHLPFETPFPQLLQYMRQYVDTVERLHTAGLPAQGPLLLQPAPHRQPRHYL